MTTTTTTTTTTTHRRSRGQTLILGAVSMLFLALMMMASYSIGNALHQKVALQSQADAASYSVAVAEARTMNVVAYFNRAIVGTLVAQASLHAWLAIATADVSQLWDGVNLFGEINAFEISEGCRMIAPWVPHPMAWLHCPHLIEAEWDGLVFFFDALSWDGDLSDLDGPFNDGVEAITKANKTIYNVAQTSVALGAAQAIGAAGPIDVMKALEPNAPNASKSAALLLLNEQQYACAFEGLKLDTCKNLAGPINPYRPMASTDDRSKVLRSAANADRPLFTSGSAASIPLTEVATRQFTGDFDHNAKEPNSLLTSGTWDIMNYPIVKGEIGESHPSFFNQYFAAYPVMGTFGKDDKADDASGGAGGGLAWIKNWGWLKPSHGHAPWNPLPFGGGVYSDSGGGGHMLENWLFLLGDFAPFDSNHGKYKGMVDVCQNSAQTSCFINYRGQTDLKKKNLGQPFVFAGYTQSLRIYDAKTGDKEDRKMATATPVWELNKTGKVNVKFQKDKTATVNYVARGEGHAVSKSMVYFHQLSDWSVPPNFFDPFWRAKLHFFTRAELEAVLAVTGDGMIGAVGPYDGEY
jgi:hypothetical protein